MQESDNGGEFEQQISQSPRLVCKKEWTAETRIYNVKKEVHLEIHFQGLPILLRIKERLIWDDFSVEGLRLGGRKMSSVFHRKI